LLDEYIRSNVVDRLCRILVDGSQIAMSYGKRVQLDVLFDCRQPMSTVQSLEIELTPVLNQDQDIVKKKREEEETIAVNVRHCSHRLFFVC
jgi:hypothetical protein